MNPVDTHKQMDSCPKQKSPRRQRIAYTHHDRDRLSKTDKAASNEERSEFERDRSRIVHSAAFRRLQGKTQVFMAGEGDFLRTRLTHSLEVAQIGKGLALRLGADPDLVETVSLIHDIGHPPFGHAGEDELKKLMKPYGGFEANAQNLRIITKLETKSEDFEGLNLTRAVIDGQIKYKEPFDGCRKKFFYEDDTGIVNWAREEATAAVHECDMRWKSFECEIMDWADEVAYAVHDLEDSIHTGYIDAAIFYEDPRNSEAVDEVRHKFSGYAVDVDEVYRNLISNIRKLNPDIELFRPMGNYSQHKASRKRLTSYLIGRYIKGTSRIERCNLPRDAVSWRYFYRMCVPAVHRVEVALINRLIQKYVIHSPQIRTLEEKGKYIIGRLFLKFMEGDNARDLLPDDWRSHLPSRSAEGNAAGKARVVSDYISGMSDYYAQRLYAKLFLPNEGSIYEVL